MDELLCPCVVVIPLDYNPDREGEPPREVEPLVLTEVLSWFDRQFGGYTPLGVAGVGPLPPGSWHGQADRSMRVGVALPERRAPEFIALVRSIGVRLRQKAMYYEIGPPSACIMTIEEEGDAAAGGK